MAVVVLGGLGDAKRISIPEKGHRWRRAPAGGYRWEELMADLWPALSSPLTGEGERLLLEVIRFKGGCDYRSSEMPHSMPPEDMLKSLAIQALARWTGLAHLREMQRVQLTTQSSALASLVGDVIQKAQPAPLCGSARPRRRSRRAAHKRPRRRWRARWKRTGDVVRPRASASAYANREPELVY